MKSKRRGIKHTDAKDEKARSGMQNKQLTAQTRKILGKHYANKYRTGRG